MSERSADMAAKRKHKNSGRLGSGEFQYTDGFNVGRAEPELKQDGPTKERLDMEALFLNAVFEVEPAAQESLESILATLPMFVMDGEPEGRTGQDQAMVLTVAPQRLVV